MPLIDYVDVHRVDDSTRELLEKIRNADGEIPWAKRRGVTPQ